MSGQPIVTRWHLLQSQLSIQFQQKAVMFGPVERHFAVLPITLTWIFYTTGCVLYTYISTMHVLERRTVCALTRALFGCWVLFGCLSPESAHKHLVTRVHALFYFLRYITNPWVTIKNDLHTSTRCPTRSGYILLMTSQSFADDVTMTRQLRHDHMNSDIWLVRYRFCSRRYSRPVV